MKKLTDAEVLTQWCKENPEVAQPTPLDLKRMRSTMLKRVERARKKVTVGIETRDAAGKPTITINMGEVEARVLALQAIGELADIVQPTSAPTHTLLDTSTGRFPEHLEETNRSYTGADEADAEKVAADHEAMTEEEKTECRLDQQDEAAKDGVADTYDLAPSPVKRRYTYVPVLSGGQPLPEVVVDAFSKKEANKLVWASLSDAQRDNCEYLDDVDVQDIPSAAVPKPNTVLVTGSGALVAAVIKAAEAQPGVFFSLLDAKPISPITLNGLAEKYVGGADLAAPDAVDQTETILSDAQPKEDDVKKAPKKSAKKAGKRIPREEIVKSPAFIAMFDKAIAASRDPKRTHCKNGHTITAAHAHVGDLKRTGRYTCDPCNQDAQAKYNGGK